MSVVAADHDTLATVGAGARAAGSSVEEVALGDSAGAAPDEQATLDQQARPGDDFDDLIDAAPDIGPVDSDDIWALRADPDSVRDSGSAEDASRHSADEKIAGWIEKKAGGG
ncbi:MAG: hypothetical protein CSA58_09780 [Micrococcales bacterium]|nr:MAG: hypothetical protein CSA58_09780 [Micrococcales bacterium]